LADGKGVAGAGGALVVRGAGQAPTEQQSAHQVLEVLTLVHGN
jgi:hypothetical protein